jgi:hypothetical protein
MSEILVSMPITMTDWFEQCMDGAGCRYIIHGQGILRRQPVHMYVVKDMSIEEIHLLLKTYIQTRVNAHEIQVSL